MIQFEWDPQKAHANREKHGVSFEEAKSVFYDEYARQFFDEEHLSSEERFIMLGLSNQLRVLVVCHCERSGGDIISLLSVKSSQIMTRIMCLSTCSKGFHDGEFCQFFTGCNRQSTYTCQVVSIGFGNSFDQAKDAQPFKITR